MDERSEEVFRLLVRERKSMSFRSGIEEADDRTVDEAGSPQLTQPDEPSIGDGTPDARQVDLRLQTRLGSERLQGRLLSIYYWPSIDGTVGSAIVVAALPFQNHARLFRNGHAKKIFDGSKGGKLKSRHSIVKACVKDSLIGMFAP